MNLVFWKIKEMLTAYIRVRINPQNCMRTLSFPGHLCKCDRSSYQISNFVLFAYPRNVRMVPIASIFVLGIHASETSPSITPLMLFTIAQAIGNAANLQ